MYIDGTYIINYSLSIIIIIIIIMFLKV